MAAALLVSVTALGISNRKMRQAIQSSMTVSDSTARLVRVLRAERTGLLNVVQAFDFPVPFLTGVEVGSLDTVRFEQPSDGLYLFVDPGCSHCEQALLEADSVEHVAGVNITVVTRRGDHAALQSMLQFAGAQRIQAFASIEGGLAEIAPSHGVPMLLLVQDGKAADFWTGGISPRVVSEVVRAAGR